MSTEHCSSVNKASDAAKYASEAMNAGVYSRDLQTGGSVKILFIGNSITLHMPLASVGWFNTWGMAASAPEKDYVHLVTRGIEEATGCKAEVRVRNYAMFERNYRTWEPDESFADDVAFEPDYLIFALGENVPALETEDDCLAYRQAFDRLVGAFLRGRLVRPNIVVRGVFWRNEAKDEQMAHVASDLEATFVRTDMSDDETMMAKGLFEHPGVQAHPGDRGMAETARRILEGFFPTDSGYEAWVNEKPMSVRPIRISAMKYNIGGAPYQRPIDQTEIAGVMKFESNGPAEIRVKPSRSFKRAVVRPLSSGVKVDVSGGEITFRLERSGYYVLELDGHHCPLEIFMDAPRDFAKERSEATLTFGPGLHEPKIVKLKDHDRVFIDKDAVVCGSFQAEGVTDVRISGYGIITGWRSRRDNNNCYREGQSSPIRLIDSSDIVVDGPVVIDSSCWCVEAFNCSNVTISHVKITGAWRYNTDGIDICNSRHVRITDSYIHSFDDSIVLKGIMPDSQSPVEDIRCERCIAWCSWGRTLEIGLETWAPHYRGIVFEDCDLIHNCHGALSVHLGGPAPVDDVSFRDIRIEYDAFDKNPIIQQGRDDKYCGKGPWSGDFLRIENFKMFAPGSMYNDGIDHDAEPYGNFKSVTVENVSLFVDEGAPLPGVGIWSDASDVRFGQVNIVNLSLNGRKITDLSEFRHQINDNGAAALTIR